MVVIGHVSMESLLSISPVQPAGKVVACVECCIFTEYHFELEIALRMAL